ncbi:unnamed protein product, partial [Polarella glacialis]
MLTRYLTQKLGRFVKDLGPEQISGKLLAGEVKLKDVELDLAALDELLLEALPCALELRHVRCKKVSIKMPWNRLRKQPVVVELRDIDVEVQIHDPKDKTWLASRALSQRRRL